MRRNPALLGIAGTLVIALVVLGCLNVSRLPFVGERPGLTVVFAEAGGLEHGDDVVVSGAKVGSVREVRLDHGVVRARLHLDPGAVRLGRATEARIVTVTLLGRAAVELVPRGSGELDEHDTIPVARTSSPYDLTSVLSQLTTETTQIDKQQLAQALRQITSTFADTPDDVRRALDGISKVAGAVGQNDEALGSLLERSRRVSAVLAGRNAQVTTLLTSGTDLLGALDDRQTVVESVLHSGQELARQLRAAMAENDAALGPALRELNTLLGTLNRNRTQLSESITGLRNYAVAFGEAVSTGPFFDAYVQNLLAPASVSPVISGMFQ